MFWGEDASPARPREAELEGGALSARPEQQRRLHREIGKNAARAGALEAHQRLWALCVQRPVLVLRGETSDLLLPETAAQLAEHPSVTLATIHGCGHALALIDPSQIVLIRDFLG